MVVADVPSSSLSALLSMPQSGRTRIAGQLLTKFSSVDEEIHAFVPGTVQPKEVMDAVAKAQGPLAGVFFGVKDIVKVEHLPRRGGSTLPPESLHGEEASIITKLTTLGAVPVGMTVSTEFAWFASGPTRNPHNVAHTPGGSSSGSAAAVAAGLVPFAVGTQTIGSVIRPASYCGVVGYKPSLGALARDGVLSVSHTLDHLGFFTRGLSCMRQLAELLQIIPRDAKVPVRIVYCVGAYRDCADASISSALDSLASLCSGTVQLFDPSVSSRTLRCISLGQLERCHRIICAREFYHAHVTLFGKHSSAYRPESADLFSEGATISAELYHAALQEREGALGRFQALARNTVYLSPAATGPAPKGIGRTGDPVMNRPWTFLGAPALTIPVPDHHRSCELPVGLQLTAAHGEDELLFTAAERIASFW